MQASLESFIADSFPLGDGLLCPAVSVSRQESQQSALKNHVIPVKKIKNRLRKGEQVKPLPTAPVKADQVSIWGLKDCFDWFE